VGVVSAIVVGKAAFDLFQARSELAALVDRGEPIRRIQAEMAAHERQRSQLQQEIATMRAIQTPDRALTMLGLFGAAARSAQGVQLQRLAILTPARIAAQPPSSAATAAPSAAELATVTLQGMVSGDDTLAQFIDSLRATEVFQRVELNSLGPSGTAPGTGRPFQLECRFAE
jgi:hypothetical protein